MTTLNIPLLKKSDYTILNEYDIYKKIQKDIKGINKHPSQSEWNEFWGEHQTGSDRPNYLNERKIYRWKGNYIESSDSLEYDYFTRLKTELFNSFLSGNESVLEVGCGIGSNLKQLKGLFPNIKTIGCDWSANAVNIARNNGSDESFEFDMLKDQFLPKTDVVLTCGSLEQIGSKTDNILRIFSSLSKTLFIHIEPIIELYGIYGYFDNIATDYHLKRDYLQNFYKNIKNPIIATRTGFGNMYNEGYMVLVWKN